jgi:hypothetical protein
MCVPTVSNVTMLQRMESVAIHAAAATGVCVVFLDNVCLQLQLPQVALNVRLRLQGVLLHMFF